jgi:glutathione synthase/RimK-type ligase-like ATP-grasp enzyme
VSTVALVTYKDLPQLCDDDRLLLDYLNGQGIRAEAVVWDAGDVAWERFGCVVLRSCWDYHLRPHEFADWVRRLAGAHVPLVNPAETVLWNMDKTYLQDLSRNGVKVAPTVRLRKGEPADLHAILESEGWEEAVIKPSISATAFQTWRTSLAEAANHNTGLQKMLAEADMLVQPFIKEVVQKGEWSLVFLGGEYSHGVLKRPQKGDFRVQELFGGSSTRSTPPDQVVEQAAKVLQRAGRPWSYARVDGIEVEGELLLMELELIEPYLFLGEHPQAAQRFGEAILRKLGG